MASPVSSHLRTPNVGNAQKKEIPRRETLHDIMRDCIPAYLNEKALCALSCTSREMFIACNDGCIWDKRHSARVRMINQNPTAEENDLYRMAMRIQAEIHTRGIPNPMLLYLASKSPLYQIERELREGVLRGRLIELARRNRTSMRVLRHAIHLLGGIMIASGMEFYAAKVNTYKRNLLVALKNMDGGNISKETLENIVVSGMILPNSISACALGVLSLAAKEALPIDDLVTAVAQSLLVHSCAHNDFPAFLLTFPIAIYLQRDTSEFVNTLALYYFAHSTAANRDLSSFTNLVLVGAFQYSALKAWVPSIMKKTIPVVYATACTVSKVGPKVIKKDPVFVACLAISQFTLLYTTYNHGFIKGTAATMGLIVAAGVAKRTHAVCRQVVIPRARRLRGACYPTRAVQLVRDVAAAVNRIFGFFEDMRRFS